MQILQLHDFMQDIVFSLSFLFFLGGGGADIFFANRFIISSALLVLHYNITL